MKFFTLVLISSVGVSLQAPRASAQEEAGGTDGDSPAPLSVTWSGPEECGPETALERETRRLLGKLAETASVEVEARAARIEEDRYRVELVLQGAVSGTRSFESTDCREAIQAAAVVLALAINPDALLAPPKEEEVQPEPPEPSSPPPAPSELSEAHAAPSMSRYRGYSQVSARMSGGVAPFPAWGAEFSLGLERDWVRVALGAFLAPSAGQELSPTGQASFLAYGTGIDVCLRGLEAAPLTLRGCAGLWFSWVRASASGLIGAEDQQAFLYTPRAELQADLRLHPHVSLLVAGGAQLPTTSVQFQVEDEEGPTTVHDVALGGLARLGFEFRF